MGRWTPDPGAHAQCPCRPDCSWGSYPSWMNSSRAAHSDTNWGRPLLSTTKDKMGSRSSAPLLGRGTAGREAPGASTAAQSPKPCSPHFGLWSGPRLAGSSPCTPPARLHGELGVDSGQQQWQPLQVARLSLIGNPVLRSPRLARGMPSRARVGTASAPLACPHLWRRITEGRA